MKKSILMLWVILFPLFVVSQNIDFQGESAFEIIEFPTDEYLKGLNRSGEDWLVIKKDDGVFFCDENEYESFGDSLNFDLDSIEFKREDHVRMLGTHHYLKTKKGWIIGANQGEWGGSLIWLSEDLKSYKHFGRANINQLFIWGDDIMILEGLSHLGMSGGSLTKIGSDMTIDTIEVFEQTPYAAEIASDSTLFIITDSKLIQLNINGKQKELFENEYWPYLYPSSIVLHKKKLYIAMRGGIALYSLDSQMMNWMRPKTGVR